MNTKPPPSWCGVVDCPAFGQPPLYRVERAVVDDGGVVVLDDERVTTTTTGHVGGNLAVTNTWYLPHLLVTPDVHVRCMRRWSSIALTALHRPTCCRVAS